MNMSHSNLFQCVVGRKEEHRDDSAPHLSVMLAANGTPNCSVLAQVKMSFHSHESFSPVG